MTLTTSSFASWPIFSSIPGNQRLQWGDILANKYPTYRVGVQFNLPLFGNKTADAQYGRSLVEGDRLNVVHDQLEQNIQVEVRNALQFVRTAEARLRSASISRENSEKQYESDEASPPSR